MDQPGMLHCPACKTRGQIFSAERNALLKCKTCRGKGWVTEVMCGCGNPLPLNDTNTGPGEKCHREECKGEFQLPDLSKSDEPVIYHYRWPEGIPWD